MPASFPSHDTLAEAVAIAHGAAAILREGYGRALQIEYKGSVDLITEYDRRSEAHVLGELRARFPDHAVLAEESGAHPGDGRYRWLVDPLDGTTNFAHGLPIFSVSMALVAGERVVLGVVVDPIRDETYTALAGEGAWRNGESIRPSATAPLDRALLVTGFPYDIRTNPDNNLELFARLSRRAQAVRRLGSASLDLAYVACGRFDGYWERRLNPWDIAAGSLIVLEAGGRVTDFDGGDTYLSGQAIVATNGHVHEELLGVLNERAVDTLPV